MIRLLAVTFLVLSAQVGAQNLHVFEDGQTIDAQRFNENFAALKNGAASSEPDADNVAVIGRPVWVDSNGNVITGREDITSGGVSMATIPASGQSVRTFIITQLARVITLRLTARALNM